MAPANLKLVGAIFVCNQFRLNGDSSLGASSKKHLHRKPEKVLKFNHFLNAN